MGSNRSLVDNDARIETPVSMFYDSGRGGGFVFVSNVTSKRICR